MFLYLPSQYDNHDFSVHMLKDGDNSHVLISSLGTY